MSEALAGREIIVELTSIGSMVRVTAMDTKSLTEIVISGPSTTPDAMLKRNAVKRLEYVLRKKGIIS
jgi:hypothetical protein